MISKLSDDANKMLYDMLNQLLALSWQELSKMKDSEVIAIFDKLTFQYRVDAGAFAGWNNKNIYQNTIEKVQNELVGMEILK